MLDDISPITGAIMAGIVLIGSVGNFLTLFVIARHRPLHDITGMFLANLAAADLLQSSFGMPLIAASAFHDTWIFGDTLCTLSGVTNSLFCITSMLTLSAIGLDRWLVIVYPLRHQSLLTFSRARIVLLYIWGQALVVALFPVFGWSRYVYLSYEFICTVQWEYNKPYTIFLCVTCFVTPLIVTVMCYASIMKVACHQARERPTTTVGEIEAEHSYMATCNQSNDDPVVNNSVMFDEGQTENAKLRRVEYKQENVDEKTKKEIRFTERRCRNSLKDLASKNENLLVKAEINTQMDSLKKEQEEVDFTSNSKQEADMADPRDTNPQTVIGKTPTELNQITRSTHTKSPNVIRETDEVAMFRKNPAKFIESNKQAQKTNLSVVTERHASINPAGLMSRMHHEHPRARCAWTREDSFGSKLGIIPEENETNDFQESPMSLIKGRTTSLGHLARMREWMAEHLMNNEKTETILKRKKDMKVVLTLLVVNGTFVLCWLPHFIGITCLTFTNGSCPFPLSFFSITTTLAMLNSGCNPFIYTLTYRKFRKAFKKVFPWLRSNRTGNINTSAD